MSSSSKSLGDIFLGILVAVAIVGLVSLINIGNSVKPLGKLGENELSKAVTQISEIHYVLVSRPPSYSPEKEITFPKAELIEGKQSVSIPPGDYRVLKISVSDGDDLIIESQLQSLGVINYHLINSAGIVKGFVSGRQYRSSLLCTGSAETYYLFLNNSFDPINPKSVWVQLVHPEKISQK